MKKTRIRFQEDLDFMNSEEFVQVSRGANLKAFTRRRKLTCPDLTYSILINRGRTTELEVIDFMNAKSHFEHEQVSISEPGYLKAREKLNPRAFVALYMRHNKSFYSDPETTKITINGYYVLAGDGTKINVPTTPETIELYGKANSKTKDARPQAQIGLESLYDALNGLILDASINRHYFNEMAAIEPMLDSVKDTLGADAKFLILLDRGYPSIPAMLRLMKKKIPFVVRLKKSDFKKEQLAMTSDDEWVDVAITKMRRHHYIGTEDEAIMNSCDSFKLRIVRVPKADDQENTDSETESDAAVYATNFTSEEFPQSTFYDLYHYRWRVETAYEKLKNPWQIENFSGTKPVILEQDIYSTIYLNNLVEDIAHEIENENKSHLENDYRYPVKVNRTIAIGMLKGKMIDLLMEPSDEKRTKIFNEVYEIISKHFSYHRDNRHYDRNKNVHRNKYSTTHRRCF